MKHRRILSGLAALLLLANLPVSALAAEWDIGNGDITVNAGSGGQTVTQGSQVDVPDSAPVITGSSTENTVTINAEKDQTASVTLSGANIDGSTKGNAAVSTTGEGNVSIELDGDSTLKSGFCHAGLEKNNGGSLTIADEDKNGKLTAEGGGYGAGIGGGYNGTGSYITISGGEVKATGGVNGAGIGGGCYRDGNNITVSGDAKLKVQGGVEDDTDGAGAGIGNGGSNAYGSQIPGAEVKPDTSGLTTGRIEYYAPSADMDKDAPSQTIVGTYIPPQPAREAAAPAQPAAPLYRVTDGDGKDVSYETTWRDGVLTVTVEADRAVLTGRLSGIASLQAQGIERIVFITKGATSEFLTADLLAAAPATERYGLSHDGEAVTFTAGEADVSGILVKA